MTYKADISSHDIEQPTPKYAKVRIYGYVEANIDIDLWEENFMENATEETIGVYFTSHPDDIWDYRDYLYRPQQVTVTIE